MEDGMGTRQRKGQGQVRREDEMKASCDDECGGISSEEAGTVERVWNEMKDGYRLYEYHALPGYLKDNEYILSYYRADFSLRQSLRSLFMIHNETVNIWTHLVGFFIFLGFTILAVLELQKLELPSNLSKCFHGGGQESNSSDHCFMDAVKKDMARMMAPILKPTTRWPFFVFLGGSMFCLLASSVCHLFTCHSKPVAIFLMRVDYAGIATMIATSFFPPIYYIFQCTPIWQVVYLTTITVMAVATLGVLFAPVCQSGKYRTFRALLFFAMGASGVFPAVHAAAAHWHEPMCLITVAHEVAMAFFYGIGTLFYATRIPERWRPGWFDLGGHSHNIFHVLVIAGAYTHYRAALLFLEWRDSTRCD